MEVYILKAGAEVLLPSGAKQTYPKEWRGVVPDLVGEQWVEAGLATDVTPEASNDSFTPRQTDVLRDVADQIAAAEDAPTDFASLDIDDLRDLAKLIKIKGYTKMPKPDLVDALTKREDDLIVALAEVEAEGDGDN